MADTDNLIGSGFVQFIAVLLAGVGALNWALVEFLDTDLLLDVLGMTAGSTELAAVYALIAGAGVVSIYNEAVWKGYL